jgi:cytochrome P450
MPVFRTPVGVWLISRYADGNAILVDKAFATVDLNRIGQAAQLPQTPTLQDARETMGRTMLFMNPPDHGRIRGLVSKAFTPRMVESLRPRIQQITDDLIARFEASGQMDLINDFAYPLPVMVIAEMLGVPFEDRDLFQRWISALAPLIDFVADMQIVDRAMAAMGEIRTYLSELVNKRRSSPKEDLVSALIAAEEKGDRLTLDEMMANTVLLLGAGYETTSNLIGNGMRALLENRSEYERLHSDPALIKSAVEECLRYDSPVQATGRRAIDEVKVGGFTIPKDEHVVVIIGACNRDPAEFPNPDKFDVGRENNDHLAFGGGVHFCLGANLARLEGQIAIGTLVRRFPQMSLATDKLEIREMFNLRGLKALPVNLGAATGG